MQTSSVEKLDDLEALQMCIIKIFKNNQQIYYKSNDLSRSEK